MDKRFPSRFLIGAGALILLAGLVLLGSMFTADRPAAVDRATVAAGETPVFAIEGAELPEDGRRYCVSILVHDDWQQRRDESRIVGWWAVHPYLRSVAGQTTYDVYQKTSPKYQRYFARAIRDEDLPAVLIQDGSGKVHWQANRDTMPASAEEMAQSVGKLFEARPVYLLPWRRPKPAPQPCPQPNPQPAPNPAPQDVPIFEPVPAVEPEPPADAPMHVLVILLVLGGLVGIVGGVVAGVKSRMGS
jgi:hypothetical protein